MSTDCVGRHQKRHRHDERHDEKTTAAAATALLGVFAFQPPAAAEQKFQKLTGGQIRAKLTGVELTDNVHWRDLYQRNGTVMSTSMDRKRTGKWRVESDQLCIEFEKEP